jgi:cytoskeletal protein CcmA (bactofilin family)
MFSANMSQPGPRGAAPSLVSSDVTITGILQSEGDMQIDGRVDGNVRCDRLVVGESGIINGEVTAQAVTVRGRIDGTIRARELMLAATARVEGDILHQTLEVETGAFVQGHFRHCGDPLAETLPDAEEASPDRRHAHSPMRAVKSGGDPEPLRAAG